MNDRELLVAEAHSKEAARPLRFAGGRLWIEWFALACFSCLFAISSETVIGRTDNPFSFAYHLLFITLIYYASWLVTYVRMYLLVTVGLVAGYCFLYAVTGIKGADLYYDYTYKPRPMLEGIEFVILGGVGGGGFVAWTLLETALRMYRRVKLFHRNRDVEVMLTQPWLIRDLISLFILSAVLLSFVFHEPNTDFDRAVIICCYGLAFGFAVLIPSYLGFQCGFSSPGSFKRKVFLFLSAALLVIGLIIWSRDLNKAWPQVALGFIPAMLCGWRVRKGNYVLQSRSAKAVDPSPGINSLRTDHTSIPIENAKFE